MNNLICFNKKLIICGDFNIHVDNAEGREAEFFLDTSASFGLKNHIFTPTHVAGHTLDLVITRDSDEIVLTNIDTSNFLSDHCIIRFNIEFPRPVCPLKYLKYRKIGDIDITKFSQDISQSRIALLNNDDLSLDEMVDVYDSTLRLLLDRHAPVKTKLIKSAKDAPWYSGTLGDLKRTKSRFEQRWRRSRTNADFLLFKNARNLYSVNLRNSKTFYFSNIFHDCGSDQRRIYKTINNLINGPSSNIYPSSDSNQHLADSFKTFFENKINNIVSSITETVTTESIADTTVYSSVEGAPVLRSFNPLNSLDVECLIRKSPNKFSFLIPYLLLYSKMY